MSLRAKIRPLIALSLSLLLGACATNIVGEKASRFDQGVAAYDSGDFANAYRIWNDLAAEDDLAAMRNVAQLLRQGKGVEKDVARAFKLYTEAAEKGLVTAMANVGDMYMAGEGVARNPEAAAAWYARAASAGLSLAQWKLADMYATGTGVAKDPERSRALLERAARNGYGPAQAKLREMGITVISEDEEAESAARVAESAAAKTGSKDAPAKPPSPKADDTRKAAGGKDARAAGTPAAAAPVAVASPATPLPAAVPAPAAAAPAATAAAPAATAPAATTQAPTTPAPTTLATAAPAETAPVAAVPPAPAVRLQPGDPVPAELVASIQADALIPLYAGITAYNAGNLKGAMDAWQGPAVRGVPEAQMRVGLLHERGEGVPQDVIEAYRWLKLAANQGYARAQPELARVAARLAPAERAIGDSLVREPLIKTKKSN